MARVLDRLRSSAKLVSVATVHEEPLRPREPLYDAESRAEFPMLRGWHKRQRGPTQETESVQVAESAR